MALPGAQRETRVARAGDAGHGAAAPVLRPFARRRAAAAGVPAGVLSGPVARKSSSEMAWSDI